MSRDEHRRAAPRGVPQGADRPLLIDGSQAGQRLVGNQAPGVPQESESQLHAPPLAAGKFAHSGFTERGDVEWVQVGESASFREHRGQRVQMQPGPASVGSKMTARAIPPSSRTPNRS